LEVEIKLAYIIRLNAILIKVDSVCP